METQSDHAWGRLGLFNLHTMIRDPGSSLLIKAIVGDALLKSTTDLFLNLAWIFKEFRRQLRVTGYRYWKVLFQRLAHFGAARKLSYSRCEWHCYPLQIARSLTTLVVEILVPCALCLLQSCRTLGNVLELVLKRGLCLHTGYSGASLGDYTDLILRQRKLFIPR